MLRLLFSHSYLWQTHHSLRAAKDQQRDVWLAQQEERYHEYLAYKRRSCSFHRVGELDSSLFICGPDSADNVSICVPDNRGNIFICVFDSGVFICGFDNGDNVFTCDNLSAIFICVPSNRDNIICVPNKGDIFICDNLSAISLFINDIYIRLGSRRKWK
jgi:hypothetical protein